MKRVEILQGNHRRVVRAPDIWGALEKARTAGSRTAVDLSTGHVWARLGTEWRVVAKRRAA